MNKDNIYKLIGYNGEYNDKVKKAIRKLLKQYHPDHDGDEKIFKLINEVKHELELNRVSFKPNKSNDKDIDDIDYHYCDEMIINLELQKKEIVYQIKKNKEAINIINNKYQKLYSENLDQKNFIINKKSSFDLKKVQKRTILFFLFLIVPLFFFALIKNYAFLIIFILGLGIIIYYLFRISKEANKIIYSNKQSFNSYLQSSKRIQKLLHTKSKLQEKEINLKRQLKKIENDLRFYRNLLKYK